MKRVLLLLICFNFSIFSMQKRLERPRSGSLILPQLKSSSRLMRRGSSSNLNGPQSTEDQAKKSFFTLTTNGENNSERAANLQLLGKLIIQKGVEISDSYLRNPDKLLPEGIEYKKISQLFNAETLSRYPQIVIQAYNYVASPLMEEAVLNPKLYGILSAKERLSALREILKKLDEKYQIVIAKLMQQKNAKFRSHFNSSQLDILPRVCNLFTLGVVHAIVTAGVKEDYGLEHCFALYKPKN